MSSMKTGKVSKHRPTQDKAHDVLRTEGHPLDAIFKPQSVAVVGASDRPGSIGRASVLGIKAYPDVEQIPETVDLAVIVTPADSVPTVIGQCVAAGVRGAIVISAGFKEHGEHGKELERQILEQLRGSGMRLI